nr:MAG TPA: hypothetical protein [Bacteriophage sp.]
MLPALLFYICAARRKEVYQLRKFHFGSNTH